MYARMNSLERSWRCQQQEKRKRRKKKNDAKCNMGLRKVGRARQYKGSNEMTLRSVFFSDTHYYNNQHESGKCGTWSLQCKEGHCIQKLLWSIEEFAALHSFTALHAPSWSDRHLQESDATPMIHPICARTHSHSLSSSSSLHFLRFPHARSHSSRSPPSFFSTANLAKTLRRPLLATCKSREFQRQPRG